MTGITEHAMTARARLRCDAHGCEVRWESNDYRPVRWGDMVIAARPAFAIGWRIYVGGRSQHTYCPAHGPKVEMRLLYGPGEKNER